MELEEFNNIVFTTTQIQNPIQVPLDFTINKMGFTGPEFNKNTDILFAGCSVTYGYALPYDATWANIVSKNLKMSHNNLSYPGGSIMQIISNIFQYCNVYGNPKIIFCLFPSFLRYQTYSDNKIIKKPTMGKEDYDNNCIINVYGETLPYLKYLKAPIDSEYIYSEGHRVWINLMFVSMLETYCKNNNIKLLWAPYINPYPENREIILNEFKNCVDVQMFPPEILDSCHTEIDYIFKPIFNYASDGRHFGAHSHAHFAEDFLKQYELSTYINE